MSRDALGALPRVRRWLFRGGVAAGRRLPLWLGRFLVYLVATLVWWCDARGRKTITRNLTHFIPPTCREAVARSVRRHYVSFAWYLYETFRVDRLPPAYFQPPHLTVHDPFGVFAHTPRPGPLIIVTVHSHWELVPAVCERLGWTNGTTVIALSNGDPAIDALFVRMRHVSRTTTLDFTRGPLGALRALKAGQVLTLAGDRDYTGHGMRIPFAGQVMSLPLGPAALAVQTGATIVPVFLARRGPTALHFHVGRPLHPDPTANKNDDVTRLLHALSTTMARFIASAPAQWVSFHDGWQPLVPPRASTPVV